MPPLVPFVLGLDIGPSLGLDLLTLRAVNLEYKCLGGLRPVSLRLERGLRFNPEPGLERFYGSRAGGGLHVQLGQGAGSEPRTPSVLPAYFGTGLFRRRACDLECLRPWQRLCA